MQRKIKQRKRIFLAVEGESEQSFIKFLQQLSDHKEKHVHLDCEVLGGGGYEIMLHRAKMWPRRNENKKGKAKESILIVDTDRAETNEDGFSLEQLISEAKNFNFTVCLLKPNLEGLFLRMLAGNEQSISALPEVHKRLLRLWPNYQKPADSYTLRNKFSFDDLIRVAKFDQHLKNLLVKIGLLTF